MLWVSIGAMTLLSLLMMLAPAPATVPPPPPIVSSGSQRMMIAWLPGEARCGAQLVAAAPMRRPFTNLVWGVDANAKPLTYIFSIDASGRTTGIRRATNTGYVPFADDVAPSLAATRFAAGAAHTSCTITYTPRQTAFADTPVVDLISYTLMPLGGQLPEEGWARIRAGGSCADRPRPEPLVQVSPDYRALPGTPGVRDWALVAYDLTADGRVVRPGIAAGTGNTALDAAALRSAAASRYTAGTPRSRCLQPYARAATTLAPPPIADEDSVRPANATCPSKHDWSTFPTLIFPPAYARRAIEGWAIVTYDVAPWGEIGNAHVVAAEPSEDFGAQALVVIRNARVPTTQGLVGCVDRVRFRMPDPVPGGSSDVATPPA